MTRIDTVKDLLRGLSHFSPESAGKHLTDDFTFSGPVPETIGKREYLDIHSQLKRAFPDWQFNVSNLSEKGNTVSGSVQVTATHTGTLTLPGLPPVEATGKLVKIPSEGFTCTFKGDKIAEFSVEKVRGGGLSGIFQQLGVRLPEEAMV
jgi:predicted ester cyclase